MDSFELNKIAGALLGTLLLVTAVHQIGDMLISPTPLEEPAYLAALQQAEPPSQAGAAPAEPEEPIGVLLASASPEDGKKAAAKCAACHTFDQGAANKIGPNLWGVIGAEKAHIEGFAYSNAMQEAPGEWTYDDLSAFLTNPRQFMPGTKMAFAGVRRAKERADIIAYLRTLAENPVPLPQAQ